MLSGGSAPAAVNDAARRSRGLRAARCGRVTASPRPRRQAPAANAVRSGATTRSPARASSVQALHGPPLEAAEVPPEGLAGGAAWAAFRP